MLNKKLFSTFSEVDYFADLVSLKLRGDGTNGGQNNTFIDSSVNNIALTRAGNATQGSWTPFGNRWSNYFDGVDDYLSIADSTALDLPGDFTIEFWVNPDSSAPDTFPVIASKGAYQGTNSWYIGIDKTNNLVYFAFGDVPTFLSGRANSVIPDQWSHVAIAREGSTIRIFINGILQRTVTSSIDFSNTNALVIGRFDAGTTSDYKGYISNFRIVKGTALYTASTTEFKKFFAPPPVPLTPVVGTSVLTCKSNRFIDESVNGFSISKNGNVLVTGNSPSKDTVDYNPLTAGGGGFFDGAGDQLTFASTAALNPASAAFTYETWIYYPTTVGTNDTWFIHDVTNGVQIGFNGATAWGVAATATAWVLTTSTLPTTGQWNHFVVVRSGTGTNQAALFLNGVRVAIGTISTAFVQGAGRIFTMASGQYTGSTRLVIGTALYNPAATSYTIPTSPYTAVTNTQLLLNFLNGSIVDSNGICALETAGNAQVSTTIKKYGTGSLFFDGSGDYLQIPYTHLLDLVMSDFTFEAWIYPTVANTAGTRIFSTGGGTVGWDATNGIHILIQTGNGTTSGGFLGFQIATNTASPVAVGNPVVIPINQWSFITVCVQGTTAYVGVNGSVNSGSISTKARPSGTPLATVGTIPGEANASIYGGYIDDLRITKGVARYTSNFTPPTKTLI